MTDPLAGTLEKLKPYLQHMPLCVLHLRPQGPRCTCGLDQLAAALAERPQPQERAKRILSELAGIGVGYGLLARTELREKMGETRPRDILEAMEAGAQEVFGRAHQLLDPDGYAEVQRVIHEGDSSALAERPQPQEEQK